MAFRARPTTYRGILMRSRLEAQWAARFDVLCWDWEYEPRCFADATGQYLPDFRIACKAGAPPIYVEIKPPMGGSALLEALRRMTIVWTSEPDAFLWLVRLDRSCPWGWTVNRGFEGQWKEIDTAAATADS